MSYINRAVEALLIKKYQTYKSVAVTGARQVGKTRMTKELFPSVKRINLKNQNLLNAACNDPQGFMESFDRPANSMMPTIPDKESDSPSIKDHF